MPPIRPRISDVARHAGVSEATVSVVLNNVVGERVRVSEATQQKVWAAVRELGYVANPVAQRLAGGHNRIVAVFTFESIFPIDSSSFYYPFLIGIEEEADRLGYDLLLVTGSAQGSKRRIYQHGVNRLLRADGAILLGHGDRSEVDQLVRDGYRFVYIGRRESSTESLSYVAADYASASEDLVHRVIGLGHRNIVYVRSIRTTEASRDRERGVHQGLERAGVLLRDGWMWRGVPEGIMPDTVQAWIDDGVTALIAEDDMLGLRIMQCADSLGLSCPADYSLAVLGNPLNPTQEIPDWMTFGIPRREMGQLAFRMLQEWLNGDESQIRLPLRATLSCTPVPGQTVRDLR
ncbi:MAG: LacI family DNA-binding transcriptional regulator [Chloroflexi bacterium]|nr:LacI family DNA-binding transcriptional regulator [Chloroflexota bacterium]